MSKKLYFLISFVLVLSLAGNVLAYDTMVWDNNEGGGDRMWDRSTNWTWTAGGEPKRVPKAGDWVVINKFADPCNGPIIDADTNAVCEWLDLGFDRVPLNEVVLTMTGGSIKGVSWMSAGYYYGGTYRFDMSGGTIDLGADGFTVGLASGSNCTFNMSGGTFNCENYLSIGPNDTNQATFNMTAGDVNLDGWFEIGQYNRSWLDPNYLWWNHHGKGHANLHGGTIETALLAMGGGGVGTMDFAGGTLIIDGDYRVPNGRLFDPCSDDPCDTYYTGTIAILADRGLITAYGTKVGEIITGGSLDGLRAVVNLDYGVANPGQTTLTAGAVDPNLAWDPDPLFGSGGLNALDVNLLSWAAGDNAASHEVYFGTSFDDVNNATTPLATQPLADVNYPVSVTWGTTYYWRIDEVNASDVPEWKGTVWNFVTIPAWATNPKPDVNATGVSPFSPVLKWDPGPVVADVNGHYVYFSTDFNDVNERDPSVLTIRDTNNYAPGDLELKTKYYWAVDEVNLSDDPNIWPSPNWYFKTTDHLTADNFNLYADTTALQAVWTVGHLSNNGAALELETDAAHVRGGKSMEFAYRNDKSGSKYIGSEAVAALPLQSGTDWTFSGIEALVLYFYGDAGNAQEALANPSPPYHILNDQMYVAVEDGDAVVGSGIVKYDTEHGYDMNDVKKTSWQEWNIDLEDPCLADVNMANVAKVYIGFGGAKTGQAGSGAGTKSGNHDTVWFDDIRLYPPRCRTEKVVADINGDCITNYADVNIMGRDWLMYDYNVPAAPISGAPVGWWKFDEGSGTTAVDSSGYGNDGTIDDASWVPGYPNDPCDPNHALHFDGDGLGTYDRVECAVRTGDPPGTYPAELMPATFTVACWVKVEDFCDYDGLVVNADDYGEWGSDSSGFYLYAGYGGAKSFGLGIRTEDGIYWLDTPDTYETDTWYHLAATYNDANTANIYDGKLVLTDANTANIYVDGKLVLSQDVGGPIRWISASGVFPKYFMIGALHDYDVLDWYRAQATIDDVRVYGYAMPYGEIVTLAEQGPVLYHDVTSPANIYDLEAKLSKIVNFRDYVILADHWLEGPILWPQ